jgi:RND superfamily putative drug exporter
MLRLCSFVLRQRRLIGLIWLIALLAGGYAAANLSSRLSQNFEIPGTRSDTADLAIAAAYHSGGSQTPLVVVVRLPAGDTVRQPAFRSALLAGFSAAAGAAGVHGAAGRVVSYASTGDKGFVSANGRTTFGLIFTPESANSAQRPVTDIAAIQRPLESRLPAGTDVRVTGITQLTDTGGGSNAGSAVASEILIGSLGALAVLAFVFASFLALLPLLIAAVSITTAFLAILGLTYLTGISFIVQYLVGLIGLGVAIDYSLLFVTRWREETARGLDNHQAIERAMATAGRSIVFSGVTVALGLLVLVVLPIPFIRSVGFGGLLIPLISVAATITLVPALLAGPARRLDRPRLRREGKPARGWTRWATLVVRQRWAATALALAILCLLGVAALNLRVGDVSTNSLSQRGPARQGVVLLEQARIPVGVLAPIEVLIPAGTRPARVTAAAAGVSGVWTAVAPANSSWRRDGTAMAVVLPVADGASPAGQATATAVRSALDTAAPGALVGGYTPGLVDQVRALYGDFPYVLAGLVLVTFILLARAFRSLLLALKAVLANLLSVAAAYGALVLIWQDGHGTQAIWGLPGTGAITSWIPLFVFAFVYGLSMDYEVFILTRMREEYDATGSTSEAVITAIGRTGRLVTSAALILFLAMAALASAPITFLKVFATGVGVGILLDATVVRSLLVPAVVAVLGRWNWWLPAWAARILRVPAAPLPVRSAERRQPSIR